MIIIIFSRVLVQKWAQLLDWSSNLNHHKEKDENSFELK